MNKIISFANQKGGVGKTSTCVNLCAALVKKGRKVLLIDADPQGNATSGLGVDKDTDKSLYEILIEALPIKDAIVRTKYGDVIPSNINLSGAALELAEKENREITLKTAISEIKDRYDYIFIDTPPSLGLLTINAMVASDSILVPMQCEYYAMEGLADLLETLRLIQHNYNRNLQLEGIVLTMYDRRLSFSVEVGLEVKKYFDKAVYSIVIPRNVRIAEAPSHGVPVTAYNPLSKGAGAYMDLASEFLKHKHAKPIKEL